MVDQRKLEEKELLRALDDLFISTRRYRTSQKFKELIKFVSRFRFYSAYNAMFIHIQRSGGQVCLSGVSMEKEIWKEC
jgi:hypothetical protein